MAASQYFLFSFFIHTALPAHFVNAPVTALSILFIRLDTWKVNWAPSLAQAYTSQVHTRRRTLFLFLLLPLKWLHVALFSVAQSLPQLERSSRQKHRISLSLSVSVCFFLIRIISSACGERTCVLSNYISESDSLERHIEMLPDHSTWQLNCRVWHVEMRK